MAKATKNKLERDYTHHFSMPAGPGEDAQTLRQPEELKVVESRTEYLVYEQPEQINKKS